MDVVHKEGQVAAAKKAKNAPELEKQLAEAKAKAEAARKGLDSPPATYSPVSPVYPKTSTGRRSVIPNAAVSPGDSPTP